MAALVSAAGVYGVLAVLWVARSRSDRAAAASLGRLDIDPFRAHCAGLPHPEPVALDEERRGRLRESRVHAEPRAREDTTWVDSGGAFQDGLPGRACQDLIRARGPG
ncbi:hypothetical protein OG244_22985 [Streptomyces brevispora]|uniref:hypothetical protein n=1 Tax=Streptomyces brevispora TaxID=887462 RepID=UPI002E3435D6|nr:hypothetical protein [Streptomyces brevispora]